MTAYMGNLRERFWENRAFYKKRLRESKYNRALPLRKRSSFKALGAPPRIRKAFRPACSPAPALNLPASVTIDAIREFIADDLRAVDEVISRRLRSDVGLIGQIADYIIGSGGKRLRPSLLILSARACGYDGRHHHELAAVVEFIHTATLLHDDVVDESGLRRGRPTANAMFGNAAAVLVGDFVYSRAFQMMVGVESMEVLRVLADATNTIAEGEVLQLMNCRNPDLDEQGYLQVIRYKTAKLFEAATRLGAILGKAGGEVEDALAAYGAHLGTAFQLIDDVLDYSGDHAVIGKNIGDDLAEGKTTLPLIYAMQHGTPEQSRRVRSAIQHGGRQELDAVVAAIRDSGALDYARAQALKESRTACVALEALPRSISCDYLLQLADFAVTRTF
jgi:octaprenyl-diphosphate synthase